MYDRFTNTMWHSLTGEPVIGELVGSGLRPPTLPVTVLTWEQWLEEFPDSTVLSLDTGHRRNYFKPGVPGSAYYEYFRDPGQMFPTFEDDDRMEIKDRVLGLSFDGHERAYSVGLVTERRVINDRLGDQSVVVVGIPDAGAVRAYDPQDNVFTPGDNLDEVVDQDGGVWLVREDGLFNAESDSTLAPGFTAASCSGSPGPRSSPLLIFTSKPEAAQQTRPTDAPSRSNAKWL